MSRFEGLWTLVLACSLATIGCSSYKPPSSGITKPRTDVYLSRVITKQDYPSLIDTRILFYYKNPAKTQFIGGKHVASIELTIADKEERVLKYFYDADASGSLLDNKNDRIVRYAYGDLSRKMVYSRDFFQDIHGVKSYRKTTDPVEKAAFNEAMKTARREERNYQWLRNTVLPREQRKRFQQTYK